MSDDDVATVLAESYHQWQYGDNGTHDSLTEAALVSREALAALAAAGYAVVKVPEGVAVAHGARLVPALPATSWPRGTSFYGITP